MKHVLILTIALAGCAPAAVVTESRRGRDIPEAPVKPAVEPGPLPPNVTREVLPDGTISITIREPRCPTCQPWTY